MSEASLRLLYRQLAQLCGWTLQYHTHDSRRSDAGFPDDVLLRPRDGRLLFVEAKSDKGRLTDKQRAWRDALSQCGAEVRVWQPRHWVSGEIEETLK